MAAMAFLARLAFWGSSTFGTGALASSVAPYCFSMVLLVACLGVVGMAGRTGLPLSYLRPWQGFGLSREMYLYISARGRSRRVVLLLEASPGWVRGAWRGGARVGPI